MIGRILLAATVAGVIAGVFISAAQMFKVVPLIYAAEAYEAPAPATAPAPSSPAPAAAPTHSHIPQPGGQPAAHDHSHAATDWLPEDGFERIAFTTLSNIVIGAGFGLLLAAGMTIRGRVTDWRQGLVWGAAGYLAFSLLPALGLPPELPGMAAADLVGRQAWWVMTAATTAGGLAFIAFGSTWAWRGIGALLILMPHVVGAPHTHDYGGLVPAELAAQFVSATLVTAGLFWLVLGGLTGHFVGRGLKT